MATMSAMLLSLQQYQTQVTNITTNMNTVVNIIDNSAEKAKGFFERMGEGLAAAAEGVQSLLGMVSKLTEATDAYVNVNTRLKASGMGDIESQQQIFEASKRSGADYAGIADAAIGLVRNGGETFQDSKDAISFVELLQKSFKASGLDKSQQQEALAQVSQGDLTGAMGSSPVVTDAVAHYLGISPNEISELAEQGVITADIMKEAMFAATDEINRRFEETPKTFADRFSEATNMASMAFAPVMDTLSGAFNSSSAQTIMDGIGGAIEFVSDKLGEFLDFLVEGGPAVEGLFFMIVLLAGMWAISMIAAAASTLLAIWPLLLIAAAIGGILVFLNKLGISYEDIFSGIGSIVGGLFAFINNLIAMCWNHIIDFAEFFANVFRHPVESIGILFLNMGINLLDVLKNLASSIDAVFGTNLAGTLSGFQSKIEGLRDSLKPDDYISFDDLRMEMMDTFEAAEKGGKIGGEFGKFLDEWDFKSILDKDNDQDTDEFGWPSGGVVPPPGGNAYGSQSNPATVKGTGKNNAMEVDISDEDIQYLRDIAQRDYVAKIATNTLAPNIRVDFSGPITQAVDTSILGGYVASLLRDELATAAEGVY